MVRAFFGAFARAGYFVECTLGALYFVGSLFCGGVGGFCRPDADEFKKIRSFADTR